LCVIIQNIGSLDRTNKYLQENNDNEFLENILRVVTDPVGGLN
jgi:hypothetical protein